MNNWTLYPNALMEMARVVRPVTGRVCLLTQDKKCMIQVMYSKCSKISNTFLILFSNKILVIMAVIHKMLVSIANREDPDQTVSSEAV